MLFILIPFSIIAAMMAFLITYEEMARHYVNRRRPMRAALRAGIFTLIFFLLLSWLALAVLRPGRF